jgi:hypothetical protein
MSINDPLDDDIIAHINNLDETHRKLLIVKISEMCVDNKPKLDIELPKLTMQQYKILNKILTKIFTMKKLPLPIQKNYVKQIEESYGAYSAQKRQDINDRLEYIKEQNNNCCRKKVFKHPNGHDDPNHWEKQLDDLNVINQCFYPIRDTLKNEHIIISDTSSNAYSELMEKLNDMLQVFIIKFGEQTQGGDPCGIFDCMDKVYC